MKQKEGSKFMFLRILVLFLAVMIVAPAFGQKKKSKKSYAQGTLFGYWGYHRAVYTKSKIQFEGSGFDFIATGVKAQDSPGTLNADYFNPLKVTTQQYNARLGYYVRNYWALSIGFDHMKYVMNDQNAISISGDLGDNPQGNLPSGYVTDTLIVTDRSNFHYSNTAGMNNFRIELTRSDPLWVSPKEMIAATTHVGLGLGGNLSYSRLRFGGVDDPPMASFSGYSVSAHFGARMEFFKHLFLQANMSTGIMHQFRARTRPKDPTAAARHAFGYAQFDLVFGFILFVRPTNDCNSCPRW